MGSRYVARASRTAALSERARGRLSENLPTGTRCRFLTISWHPRSAKRGHERIERSPRSRALAPSARGRRERSGRLFTSCAFNGRARAAPPRAMLTTSSCFPRRTLSGATKIDACRLGEEAPQRSTQRRLVFSARRGHEQLGEGGRGRAGCSWSLRRPRLDDVDRRRKRGSFVEARARARVARRARGRCDRVFGARRRHGRRRHLRRGRRHGRRRRGRG